MEKREFFVDREKLTYSFSEQELNNQFTEEHETVETPSVFYLNLRYSEEIYLPISIFKNELTPFQAIIKYLRENLLLSNKKIAALLGRETKSIWNTYKAVKRAKQITPDQTSLYIPLSLFKNKALSAFEVLIVFLKNKDMTYAEISRLLNKDQRTIWTVHARAKKKMAREENER
jgi:hypothetical protein